MSLPDVARQSVQIALKVHRIFSWSNGCVFRSCTISMNLSALSGLFFSWNIIWSVCWVHWKHVKGWDYLGHLFMGSIFTTMLVGHGLHGYHRCSGVTIRENISDFPTNCRLTEWAFLFAILPGVPSSSSTAILKKKRPSCSRQCIM